MRDFIFMGGYAAYIWPAWIIGVLILGGITLASVQRYRRSSARLDEMTSSRISTENRAENG